MLGVDVFTFIGMVGTGLIIGVYFANQQGWLGSTDWRYQLANLVGACLIFASLWVEWNLAAALIEVFWAAISLYGLARNFLRR